MSPTPHEPTRASKTTRCQCFLGELGASADGRGLPRVRAVPILATSPWAGIPSTATIVTTGAVLPCRDGGRSDDRTRNMEESAIELALARQRLLDAAAELFYSQGMHGLSTGGVVEKAGVPGGTLREAFGGPEGLVRAFLGPRHTRLQDALARDLPGYRTPRE